MRRRSAPTRASGAMRALTDRLEPLTPLARVQRAWEAAVGAALAPHATPAAVHDGVLTVDCSAGVWAQELALLEGPVVAALEDALGPGVVTGLRPRVAARGGRRRR